MQPKALLLAAILALSPLAASAQFDPSRPVTLVVPFASGGTDVVGRLVARKLSERIGTPVIVRNRPGAGSLLGAAEVAAAKPDGLTLLVATNSAICVTPVLYKEATCDPVRDFIPLALVSGSPFYLIVNANVPARSLKELLQLAKQRQLSYSSAGSGSTAHIFMELLAKEAGVKMLHVAYKGSAPALQDVLAGFVDITFTDPAMAMKSQKALRFLGISTKSRHPTAPEVPTISEAGVPGYDALAWIAVVAPAKTPSDITRRLNSELNQVVGSADFGAFLETNGSVIVDIQTIEGVSAFFKSEIDKWGGVVRALGLEKSQ